PRACAGHTRFAVLTLRRRRVLIQRLDRERRCCEVVEGKRRAVAARAPITLRLLHRLQEVNLAFDPRVAWPPGNAVSEQLVTHRVGSERRVLDDALRSDFIHLGRKLSDRLAGRNTAAPGE